MAQAFKLLVYAVVAAAVIGLVYAIMMPLLFPQPNNTALIEQSLLASETGLGRGFTTELSVQEGDGFAGETFDSKLRNVAFQCNSSILCCPQQEACDLTIEWDNRRIKFNKQRTVLATTRCELKYGLYACTVYLGEKPAQIQIDRVNAPKEVDLSKQKISLEIGFSNSGNQETQQTEIEVEVFRRYLQGDKWVEKEVPSASRKLAFGGLQPGETRQEKVHLNIGENGSFRAKIRASGLEAGYDERSVQFATTGASDKCNASFCDSPGFSEGKCIARCYCRKCMLGSECQKALLEAGSLYLGLPQGIELDSLETIVLGSNIVDLVLPDEHCQQENGQPNQGQPPEPTNGDYIPLPPLIPGPYFPDPKFPGPDSTID